VNVDFDFVRAIAESLSKAEILAARLAAVTAGMKGPHVQMTSSSFADESSAGVFVDRDPKTVVAYCNAALDYLTNVEAGSDLANPQINHFDFRCFVSGW